MYVTPVDSYWSGCKTFLCHYGYPTKNNYIWVHPPIHESAVQSTHIHDSNSGNFELFLWHFHISSTLARVIFLTNKLFPIISVLCVFISFLCHIIFHDISDHGLLCKSETIWYRLPQLKFCLIIVGQPIVLFIFTLTVIFRRYIRLFRNQILHFSSVLLTVTWYFS